MTRTARVGRTIAMWLTWLPAVALPQVVRDGTIGPGVSLQPTGPDYLIPQNMGALAGSNLFHSFAEFSLAQGQSATFRGQSGIDNVIARVTGSDASFIDGLLRSQIPGADLWLLNPRGVMFGPHASLNLTGSLNISTASSLDFDDGAELRADAGPAPVLSVAAPTAFRLLGGAPGRIEVDGAVLRNPAGFSLRSGVIEIGGGGALAASASATGRGGDIDLLASHRISLTDAPPMLGDQAFGTVDSRTLGAEDAGDIRLEAPVVELVDGGTIRSVTAGDGRGGNVSIVASEEFTLSGMSRTHGTSSEVAALTASTGKGGSLYVETPSLVAGDAAGLRSISNGPGVGGDVTVEAGRIEAEESSEIVSITLSSGRGGDVAVTAAEEIFLGGHSTEVETRFGSTIGAQSGVGAAGDGGSVTIEAPLIVLIDGARIDSGAFGTGDGGDVLIEADSITVSGRDTMVSHIAAASLGGGNAGNLVLHTGRLLLEDGGAITSDAFSSGLGGYIEIVATESVTVQGNSGEGMVDIGQATLFGGGIVANARQDGAAGSITITAPRVALANGGSIASSTTGTADGGTILITADELLLDGTVTDDRALTQIRADSGFGFDGSEPSGNAGLITLIVHDLVLTDGASISSSSFADGGAAGSIHIDARGTVRVAGGSTITTETQGSGDAGEITVEARGLELTDGARITSSSLGTGDAGAVHLEARDHVLITGRSAVTTEAQGKSGDAGDITLEARGLELTDGGLISSSSDGTGDAGNIDIAAHHTVNIDGGTIATDALQASGGNINVSVGDELTIKDGEISTSVMSGIGSGGTITIGDPDLVLLDDGRIVAWADEGSGGQIQISSEAFLKSGGSIVDASATGGRDGVVSILARDVAAEPRVESLAVRYVDAASLLRQQCVANDSRFVVRSRRGQPASPEEMLLAFDAVDRSVTPEVAQFASASGGGSLVDGELMLRGGRDEDAAALFRGAVDSAASAGDAAAQADALRGLGQSLQAQGLYVDSLAPLRSALAIAEGLEDRGRASAALINLGNAELALGNDAVADDLLTRAVVLAQQVDDAPLQATAVNAIGNKYVSTADFETALESFEESAALARRAGDPYLALRALANAARAALRAAKPDRARTLMEEAHASVAALPASLEKVQLLVHLGRSHAELARASSELREESLLSAFEALSTAEALARSLPDQQRALSFALGNLAALYELEHRVAEALYLNSQAQAAAEEAGATDAAYRWDWQEGRLRWARGEPDAAIKAYRRAVDLLEETRQAGQARYGAPSGHFREAIAPVYLDLVDSLLRASDMLEDSSNVELLLEEARQTMEQLKAAELRDYFRDECAAGWHDVFKSHWPATAVVYPIVLADRLELLVSLPEAIERHRVPVSSVDLSREVHTFREQLEERVSPRHYRPTAKRLYDWLIAPYAASLAAAGVETLVFVPDGALRSMPISALYDGEDFVVARYATVTAASLALIDLEPLAASHHALLAGLSESVDGFPGLPNVPEELGSIRAAYGGKLLLDAEFTRARFESAMADRQPAIVHIASHGQFTGDPATSFLLTHDGALSMSELEQSVSARSIPLEMLVLSACETAAGDERAALGLAGVGLRAGARSAVGSLWNVSDAATALLFEDFYGRLHEPGTSRAAAMRAAQRQLLESERFNHPFFWSGFLLINSWL